MNGRISRRFWAALALWTAGAGAAYLHEWRDGARLGEARLAAEHDARVAADLRGENEELSARIAASPPRSAPRPASADPTEPAKWPPDLDVIAAGDFVARDQTSPRSALESALVAARQGDVLQLARLLVMDPKAKAQAQALWSGLSDEARAPYPSADALVASLVAATIPTDYQAVGFPGQAWGPSDAPRMTVGIEDAAGAVHQVLFGFQAGPDGWQLQVPAVVLSRLAISLRQPEAGPLPPGKLPEH